MSKTLGDFVKDNSKFLKLGNGESFEGVYKGYKVGPSKFDPEKETCVYKFSCEGEDEKFVYFQTASVAVAKIFSQYKGGEKVKITRQGEGTNTKYKIVSPDVTTVEELEADEETPF